MTLLKLLPLELETMITDFVREDFMSKCIICNEIDYLQFSCLECRDLTDEELQEGDICKYCFEEAVKLDGRKLIDIKEESVIIDFLDYLVDGEEEDKNYTFDLIDFVEYYDIELEEEDGNYTAVCDCCMCYCNICNNTVKLCDGGNCCDCGDFSCYKCIEIAGNSGCRSCAGDESDEESSYDDEPDTDSDNENDSDFD